VQSNGPSYVQLLQPLLLPGAGAAAKALLLLLLLLLQSLLLHTL
jgi:hypothetical protein